jgi:septum site-determining protein MinC
MEAGTVLSQVRQRHSLMFRPRSYMAFAITPRAPIVDWLADLDAGLDRAEQFFAGQAVALDLSAVNLSANAIAQLVSSLEERRIRILGIEGIDPAKWEAGLPPVLRGGRSLRAVEPKEPKEPESTGTAAANVPVPAPVVTPLRARPAPQSQQPASLMIEEPVRSGQSVIFTEGDVTVLGSVGWGAEIVAGGSIHVYGTLRGRALAGATGDLRARIFCHRIEAELLAIDSYYRTADEIEDSVRHRPVQAWLENGTLKISAMN